MTGSQLITAALSRYWSSFIGFIRMSICPYVLGSQKSLCRRHFSLVPQLVIFVPSHFTQLVPLRLSSSTHGHRRDKLSF